MYKSIYEYILKHSVERLNIFIHFWKRVTSAGNVNNNFKKTSVYSIISYKNILMHILTEIDFLCYKQQEGRKTLKTVLVGYKPLSGIPESTRYQHGWMKLTDFCIGNKV